MASSTFWRYTVWYVLLAVVTVLEVIYVLVKARNPRLAFGFYLTMTGVALSYETVILIFFKAYNYYPMLIQYSAHPFDRLLAGNLFSQFSVAATALVVTVFDLGFYWFIIFAATYGMVEELFLVLGIYSHNWYQTWMTVAGLLVYFWLSKKMYMIIKRDTKAIIYYVYIYLGLFPLSCVTIIWGFMVSGHLAFSTTVLPDPISSRYFLALAIFATPSAFTMMFIHYKRMQIVWKLFSVLMLYVYYYIFSILQVILFQNGWFFVASTTTMLWMYLTVCFMDKLYDQRKLKEYEFL